VTQIPLYTLGLLRSFGPQHGYQIKKVIAERLADFTDVKLPTIYYHLQRLEEEGLVGGERDQSANRPEKTVYAITRKGEAAFERLLDEALRSGYRPSFALDAALFFSGGRPTSELESALASHVDGLKARLRALAAHRAERLRTIPAPGRLAASLIFSHHEHHYQAELRWAEKALAQLVEGPRARPRAED
jgi:DNA-binding PadR family transcriptional regulator